MIRPGHFLVDNDPRMPNRKLIVTDVFDEFVYAKDLMGRSRKISIKRIYTDGKPRKSGFDARAS